jgi:hypothetical protein
MTSPATRKIALVVPHADSAATLLRFDSPLAGSLPAVLSRLRLTFGRIHSSLNPPLPVFFAGGLTPSWSFA